jgi:hypothetical protein
MRSPIGSTAWLGAVPMKSAPFCDLNRIILFVCLQGHIAAAMTVRVPSTSSKARASARSSNTRNSTAHEKRELRPVGPSILEHRSKLQPGRISTGTACPLPPPPRPIDSPGCSSIPERHNRHRVPTPCARRTRTGTRSRRRVDGHVPGACQTAGHDTESSCRTFLPLTRPYAVSVRIACRSARPAPESRWAANFWFRIRAVLGWQIHGVRSTSLRIGHARARAARPPNSCVG